VTQDQAKQQYDSQGFVYIPQALTPAEVERTREALHRAAANDALERVLTQDEVFVDMVDHPAILPVVHAVVGDDVMLRYAFGGVRVANTDSGGGWHCDLSNIAGVYLPDSPIMTKVYTYLADVPENGATLALVPGSHRFEMGHPLPDIAAHEDMPHHVKLVARAGDAVLFNGYCWHARFHNRSNCDREVLEYSYVHSWMRAQYDYRDMPPHIQQLMTQSHDRRQLFGVPEPGLDDWERRLECSDPYVPIEVGS
jgi:phytanoyl-CoA hydroxylase